MIVDIDNIDYTVRAPSMSLKYKAEIYKQRLIDKYKYELPLLEDYNQFLIQKKMLDFDYESKINTMSDRIRQLKKELFLCGPLINKETQVRASLTTVKNTLYEYLGTIELLRRPTLEYFVDNLKNRFILINTVFIHNKLVFDTDDVDIILLTDLVEKINEYDVKDVQFREIARTNPWQDYWRVNKNDLFGIPVIEYSEDQKTLCSLSRMYDNIWEHPECPSDDVIADDDKLDGFLIYQSEERNKNKSKKSLTDLSDKYDEVYIQASSQDEANSIYSQNSPEAVRILKQRAHVLKNKEEVKDIDFIDRRMDFIEQSAAAETAAIRQRSK